METKSHRQRQLEAGVSLEYIRARRRRSSARRNAGKTERRRTRAAA